MGVLPERLASLFTLHLARFPSVIFHIGDVLVTILSLANLILISKLSSVQTTRLLKT